MKSYVGCIAALLVYATSLTSALGFTSMGIQNCVNKCDKVFDRTQYAISDQPGQNTFEYRSCIIGCNRCSKELAARPAAQTDNCFSFCKKFSYGKNGIRKGVIEPDKACIMGCVINTW
jgi:hypothetical protein